VTIDEAVRQVREGPYDARTDTRSRVWLVLADVGWHPRLTADEDERAHYQALWALADEADEAERRGVALGRRAGLLTAAAGGSASMQGVSRGLGSLRVERRAWEQYAAVIADDVAIMVGDRSLDSAGRGRRAAERLVQARREAPDHLARRSLTSGS
jgi:hypothetical protein